MKVLYIIHSCKMGGATISFFNLVKGMVEKGTEVVVVHPIISDSECIIDRLKGLGVECYSANVVSSYNYKGKFFFITLLRPFFIFFLKIRFYVELNKIIKKENPDIIHTNTGVVQEGFFIAKRLGIPHVWHLREYQTKDFGWKPLPSLKRFKELVSRSFTISITKDIQSYFKLENNKKSFVIYNPVYSKDEIQIGNYSENYFLVANRVSKEKGIEDIIKAFSLFIKQNTSFVLKIAGFGDEEYIKALKTECKNLNILDKVQFLGYTDGVKDLLLHTKALIVGSYSEGFGRMTAEANMLSVPVLGRNTAGTKEILNQTNGGWLFNNIEELKDKMEFVSKMSLCGIASFMIEPAHKALNLFCNEQHIDNILKLYKFILNTTKNDF